MYPNHIIKLFFFTLLLSQLVLAQNRNSENPETGTITGTITKPDGSAIEGAILILTSENTREAGTETDASGKFILDNLQTGIYNLKAELIGYKSADR